jgi:hypothetical protein
MAKTDIEWLEKDCRHCLSYPNCGYIETKAQNPRGCSCYTDLEPMIECRQEILK